MEIEKYLNDFRNGSAGQQEEVTRLCKLLKSCLTNTVIEDNNDVKKSGETPWNIHNTACLLDETWGFVSYISIK